ncbi:MAG: YdcF family protein [Flavobacteriales bacterium]|nr:YdcF family protein [Flavobacteriales bacterium]
MRKWIIRGMLVMGGVNVILLLFAHPFFAVNKPIGARTVLVEGWLEGEALKAAAHEVMQRDAQLVLTTGTYRAFRYYMNAREVMDLAFAAVPVGVPVIQVAGTLGAGFSVVNGTDTIAHGLVTPDVQYYTCRSISSKQISIHSWNTNPAFPADVPNIFIRAFKVDGRNVNELLTTGTHTTNNGSQRPARATEAEQAADELVLAGIPQDRIVALPTQARPGQRTRTNAQRAAEELRQRGIDSVDVITLGVHARRTRALLRKAVAKDGAVGVVSLPDPECAPGTWWRSKMGWGKMLKEVLGLGQAGATWDEE